MRILHVLGAQDDTGGILTVLRNLAVVMAPMGVAHTVWVGRGYRETRRPPLDYRFSRWLLDESPNHPKLFVRALLAWPELRRLRKMEPFDLLHAHSRGGLVLALLASGSGREAALFTNHAYARRLGLYRWAAARPHLLCTVLTPRMARHYGLPIGPPGPPVVSECCADAFFAEALAPGETGRPRSARPLQLVGLGNRVRWKKWHLLLEALAELTPQERGRLEFLHYGPIPEDPEARAYAQELAARAGQPPLQECARFLGPAPSVPAVLQAADWFVLPSTREPCSVALIEALALGIPVVASASGGNVDLVQPGRTGLLFEPDDVGSLAATLRRLVQDAPTLLPRPALRESVRERAASAVAARYLRLYRELAGAGGDVSAAARVAKCRSSV